MASEVSVMTVGYPGTDDDRNISAYCAFQGQLRTLCLSEFPCGIGSWRADDIRKAKFRSKHKDFKKSCLLDKYLVTSRDYNAQHEMVETLTELATSKYSPWTVSYDWSEEASALREMAVKSPWLVDQTFICRHFKTLRIVDKAVTEVDERMLLFENLEQLTLTANYINNIDSRCLPTSLKFLELCANEITDISQLCTQPPALVHIGLGYNQLLTIDDCLTGQYWPELRSVDLAHNHLTDLLSTISTLHSLPKLRNLVLYGNPFCLVPAYRGYTIDMLRRLDFLDDVSVTADEKHHFRGLAKTPDCGTTGANILLSVPVLRGLLPPEELSNPDGQPEFPKVAIKYLVQWLFVNEPTPTPIEIDDSDTNKLDAEIQQQQQQQPASSSSLLHSSISQQHPSSSNRMSSKQLTIGSVSVMSSNSKLGPVLSQQQGGPPQASNTLLLPPPPPPPPPFTTSSPSGLPLIGLRSEAFEWTSGEVELNWTELVTVTNLMLLRDFCAEGIRLEVLQEKILSYPKEEEGEEEEEEEGHGMDGSGISQKPSEGAVKGRNKSADKSKAKKDDKHGAKGKEDKKTKDDKKTGKTDPKADKHKGKKGKKEPEIPMVHMPPEYTPVAVFHIALEKFLDADYSPIEMTHTLEHPAAPPPSPTEPTDKQKDKSKKGAAAAADNKKDAKKKNVKGGKGKGHGKGEHEEEECHALEVHAMVKFCHWKTAADANKPFHELLVTTTS